jgi:hypothetical protein
LLNIINLNNKREKICLTNIFKVLLFKNDDKN